jgi:two-component system phosphate regulon sensor histidine kinase PhoR
MEGPLPFFSSLRTDSLPGDPHLRARQTREIPIAATGCRLAARRRDGTSSDLTERTLASVRTVRSMDLRNRERAHLSGLTDRLIQVIGIRGAHFSTALQIPFAIIFLPLTTWFLLASSVTRPAIAWSGVFVVLLACIAAWLAQRITTPSWAPAALCAANFLALGLVVTQLGPESPTLTPLVLIPSLWLAYAYLWRGAVWAVIATCALNALASWTESSMRGISDWPSPLVLPLVTAAMVAACAIITEGWEVQRSRLREDRAQLDESLTQLSTTAVLLQAMLDTLDSAVVAFGNDGEILISNSSQIDLYPLTWSDEIGSSERQVFEEDRTTPLPEDLYPSDLARRGQVVTERLMWFGGPADEQRAVLATSRPMLDADGVNHGVMVIYHDVTAVVSAMRVKDDFVATVSHELRTPLTSILGYLELIRGDHEDQTNPLKPETLSYLKVVDRNADHLLTLVSDLLTTAQATAGTVQIVPSEVDLATLVTRSVESLAPRFAAAGVRLEYAHQPIPNVHLDARRISQVLDNLLSNALKYTPKGGSVIVSTLVAEHSCAVVVTDTGIGMSSEDLDQVFEKFHRAHSATSRQIPGIGLGLAITKAIVDAHRGTITISSTLGEGTTVTVWLPRSRPHLEAGA